MEARPASPTRRHTPHPSGLKIQNSYNQQNDIFWIWNFDRNRIRNRYRQTFPHIEMANFTCHHNTSLLESR